jgi:glycosyltransferase involved in cell wall biosynthesis
MFAGVTFPGKLALQQRVLPAYRAAFLERLASSCQDGLSVFAGAPLEVEGITPVYTLGRADLVQARNWYVKDPSSAFFLCWQGGFLRWLEETQPAALVVEANPRYPVTRLAIRWMHRRGRPVVGWGLGAPPLSGRLAKLRRWERLSLLRSLDAIVAYSRTGAEQYRQLGLPAERVFVASNAADPAPTLPPPIRSSRFNEYPQVLFVGRLQSRKRIDLLLQACARLPVRLQPRLVIVGDGPARAEFESLAQQVYPQAGFAGARHGTELEPYFQAADLFVLPGTGGLAVQQAMARALPVIVAQGDGTQDDLVRPANGWQVPPDDLEALTVTLLSALSDPTRLRQMGRESYRIVREEVNIESMVGVFVQVLKQVCASYS